VAEEGLEVYPVQRLRAAESRVESLGLLEHAPDQVAAVFQL
jgi:hypothetical protein